ncbi:MAG: ABC transporter ATP-binding protein [Oscillospiraceae bacterium]
MEQQKHVISVQDLVVKYITRDEVVEAVNGVSFDVNYGETLGLVGETGAGKTTIAKSILRILQTPPAKIVSGKILLDDEIDLVQLSNEEMRQYRGKRISMVFQDPMTALNPVIKVGDQIANGIRLHKGCSKKEARKEAMDILELVGIPGSRWVEYPHQFSGGMKQRVVIAMALSCNPDLLIADEPTSALDVTIQAQVLEMIAALQKQKQTAMILITHDLAVVAENCKNVAIVYAGEIVEYGTIEQVYSKPRHPYTISLFDSIPDTSTEVERLKPIAGLPPDPTKLPAGCKFQDRCPYATEACSQPVPDVVLADGHKYKCIRKEE